MNHAIAKRQWKGDIVSGNATILVGLAAALVVTAVTIAEIAGANWHIVLYALVSLFFPLGVALFRIRQFGISDPGAGFLVFFAGYNGFLLCRIAVGDLNGDLTMPYPITYSSDVYTECAFLSFVFSVVLAGALFFLSFRTPRRAMIKDDVNPVAGAAFPVGIAFFAIGLLFFFVNFTTVGGFRAAVEMSKMERFEIARDAGFFLPYMPFATVGLMLLALAFWKTRSFLTFATLAAALTSWAALGFVLQDRTASAYALLCVLGLLGFLRSWKLSYKLVLFAVVIYLAFTVYAQVRWIIPRIAEGKMTSQAAGEWVQANSAEDWIMPENNEFAGPYYSLVYNVDNPPKLRWGKSYLEGLLYFLPKQLYPGRKPTPIGNEFAQEIHSHFATAYFPVSGWGYSPVAEAYVNFSWTGVVIVPIMWAIGLDLLERLRWRGLTGLLCATALLPQLQNANRINFLWAWTEGIFAIVVCICGVALARFVANATSFNRPVRVAAARAGRA
jgi:hypothetical protein